MGLIAVAADGRGFAERDSGHPYIPFGTNCYDPNTGWAPQREIEGLPCPYPPVGGNSC
jgi:hypothetical protein